MAFYHFYRLNLHFPDFSQVWKIAGQRLFQEFKALYEPWQQDYCTEKSHWSLKQLRASLKRREKCSNIDILSLPDVDLKFELWHRQAAGDSFFWLHSRARNMDKGKISGVEPWLLICKLLVTLT